MTSYPSTTSLFWAILFCCDISFNPSELILILYTLFWLDREPHSDFLPWAMPRKYFFCFSCFSWHPDMTQLGNRICFTFSGRSLEDYCICLKCSFKVYFHFQSLQKLFKSPMFAILGPTFLDLLMQIHFQRAPIVRPFWPNPSDSALSHTRQIRHTHSTKNTHTHGDTHGRTPTNTHTRTQGGTPRPSPHSIFGGDSSGVCNMFHED